MRVQARRSAGVSVLALALLLVGAGFSASPAFADPTPPLFSPSFYVDYNTTTDYYQLGSNFGADVRQGTKPQDSIVILDWGGQDQNANNTWGAVSPATFTFRSNATIEGFSADFARGFFVGTGT